MLPADAAGAAGDDNPSGGGAAAAANSATSCEARQLGEFARWGSTTTRDLDGTIEDALYARQLTAAAVDRSTEPIANAVVVRRTCGNARFRRNLTWI